MKKSENRHAIFIETFRLIHSDRKKYIYRLKNHDFEIHERRLLRAFLEFYRNHKEKSLSLLKTSPLTDRFLEGVRLYLIGVVYNQNSHYHYAIENLEKSIEIFNLIENYGFIMNPVSLLIITHSNRKEVGRMGVWIRELRKFKPQSNIAHLTILHCEILYAAMTGDTKKSLELIKQAAQLNYPEYKAFLPHFLIIQISLYVREKRYAECKETLKTYSKSTETAVAKANYAYIKALVDHLHENKPLYYQSGRFKEFPELFEQLEVIKNLSARNLELAKKYWVKLQKHNPELYQDDFRFMGDECLFSQALEKYESPGITTEWNISAIQAIPSKLDRLDYLLTIAKEPLPAEDLIKIIWEEEVNEKNLARLRKLVSLYSKKKGVEVISRRKSYRIK